VGATVSYRLDQALAFQGMLGWSFGQRQLQVSADAIYDVMEIPSDDDMGFSYPLYFGAGLRVRSGHPSGAANRPGATTGVRFPLGVGVIPDRSTVEVFFELVPVMVFAPYIHGGWDAGLGGRISF